MRKTIHATPEDRMELTEADRRLLRELQRDCGRTAAELAEVVGSSQATVWRRIQRLREKGFIRREMAVLDPAKLDIGAQVFCLVKLTTTGRANVSDFADAVRAFPEVVECHVVMGANDFLLRVVAEDIAAYERFFYERLSRLPGVQDLQSMVAMSETKAFQGYPV